MKQRRDSRAQRRSRRTKVELDSHSRMDCLAAELSLHSCSLDTVRGQEEGGGAGLSQQDGLSRCRVVPPQLLSGHCQRSRGRRWSWTLTAGWIVSPQSCPSTVALWTLSEVKRKEVELDSHSWMDCLAAELSHNSCFSDTVLVTLLRTAVETAVSEVHELLHTGGVPSSLTLLFWRGPQLLNTVVLAGSPAP